MPYIDRDAFIKQQRELYCKDCTRRMGVKNGKLKEIYKIGEAACKSCELNDVLDDLDDFPEADVAPVVHAHWVCYKCSRFLGWKDGEAEPRWADGKFYCCSRCRRRTVIREKSCPSCHAMMDEEVKYDAKIH